MDEATGAEFKLESAIGRARNRALKTNNFLMRGEEGEKMPIRSSAPTAVEVAGTGP